jgi:tartrate dehydratase beta subunit/fumarate hydratase class I family protein
MILRSHAVTQSRFASWLRIGLHWKIVKFKINRLPVVVFNDSTLIISTAPRLETEGCDIFAGKVSMVNPENRVP